MVEVARQHKGELVAVAFLILALVAAAAYGIRALLRSNNATPFQNFTITQLTSNGKVTAAAISPDSKYLLSVVAEGRGQSVWLRNLPTQSDTQVIAPADLDYYSVAFSPDGNYVYLVQAADNASARLQPASRSSFRRCAAGDRKKHRQQSQLLAGRKPDRVSAAKCAGDREDSDSHGSFRWHGGEGDPDVGPERDDFDRLVARRRTLRGIRQHAEDALSKILMDPVKGRQRRDAHPDARQNPGKHPLDAQRARPRDALHGEESARSRERRSATSPIPEANSPLSPATPTTTSRCPSPATEKRLQPCSKRRPRTLFLLPAAGFTGSSPHAAAAQNHNSFAFGWQNNGGLFFDDGSNLLRVARDGSGRTTVLSEPEEQILRPSACPGTRFVTFVRTGSQQNGQVNVWRANDDGTNLSQLTTSGVDIAPLCSPDGKWVYYHHGENPDVIMRTPLAGGPNETVPGTDIPGKLIATPQFDVSPDQKLLAMLMINVDPNDFKKRIALVPLNAGPHPEVRWLDPDSRISSNPIFTPDGKALVYPVRQNGVDNLRQQPLDGGSGRQITNFDSDTIRISQYSPDGKTLGVLQVHAESDVVLLRDASASK